MAINGTFTPLTSHYTKTDNYVKYNKNISVEARYLYDLIQSQITNPHYTIYKQTIFNIFGGSRQRFDKYWRELKNLGLLVIHKLRDAKNQFYYQYELIPGKVALKNAFPDPDFPPMEKPYDGNATTWKTSSYNKTEINKIEPKIEKLNTLFKDDDHDPIKPSLSKNRALKNDLALFQKTWTTVTGKSILLSATQKQAIDKLITTYSYQTVLDAVQKINESRYLMNNINVMYFIKCFEKIYSDTYKDRVNIQSQSKTQGENRQIVIQDGNTITFKKTRFNIMDSRKWDFEELDRLEDEYIDRKLQAKYKPLS